MKIRPFPHGMEKGADLMALDITEESATVCSFCGRRAQDVALLITGPGVAICDECVKLCNDIVDIYRLPWDKTPANDRTAQTG
jgi:hypothetical protein